MLKALATAPGDFITPDTKHSSFKARTTGVSNPVRSPSFRASASVSAQQPAFAAGVPLDIYAFHRYTENSSRSEEHTSELQSQSNLVCRLLLEKNKTPESH